jgi:hypothetical protein
VTNAGITIAHGASNSITLTGDHLTISSDDIDVRSDRRTTMRAGATATIDAGSKTLAHREWDRTPSRQWHAHPPGQLDQHELTLGIEPSC